MNFQEKSSVPGVVNTWMASVKRRMNHNGFHGSPYKLVRHAGYGNRAERESGHEKVGKRVIGQEYRNDEDHRAENLRAGVHPVQERVARVVLSKRHICQHDFFPPSIFAMRSMASFVVFASSGTGIPRALSACSVCVRGGASTPHSFSSSL